MIRLAVAALLTFGVSAFAVEAAVERLPAEQWCAKHDLPKNKCVECDKKLIPALKKEKDWCAEHSCAESVCVKCNPVEAKALLDAQRPATPTK